MEQITESKLTDLGFHKYKYAYHSHSKDNSFIIKNNDKWRLWFNTPKGNGTLLLDGTVKQLENILETLK